MLNRVTIARGYLKSTGVDAVLFLNVSNIRYISGFSGSDGALIIGEDAGWFLTDSRYTAQARLEVSCLPVSEYRGKLEGIASLIREMGFNKVGFEAEHMTVALHNSLADSLPGVFLVPLGPEIAPLRSVKDAAEISCLAETAKLASESLLSVVKDLRPGVTERQLALELEFAMKRRGADGISFDFIVASGERGALPHGRAGAKEMMAGELVTIDFGAVCNGYCSDETVTIALGEPDRRQRDIYRIVKEAHDRAIEAVKPGVSFRDLDSRARGHIEAHGYGGYFGHGLGHGVGLEVHENPVVSFRSDGVAEEGMVFTVEPGVYIPGWGGVRIEDTVCVTADGCELLTRVPKELMIL